MSANKYLHLFMQLQTFRISYSNQIHNPINSLNYENKRTKLHPENKDSLKKKSVVQNI